MDKKKKQLLKLENDLYRDDKSEEYGMMENYLYYIIGERQKHLFKTAKEKKDNIDYHQLGTTYDDINECFDKFLEDIDEILNHMKLYRDDVEEYIKLYKKIL